MNESWSLPSPLHARLTVVRVDAGDDVADLARRLASRLLATRDALDLRPSPGPLVPDAGEVWKAALERAHRAHEQRAAARDEAVGRRSGLAARRTLLVERADWCDTAAGAARALMQACATAAAAVDAAREEVDAAASRRDRVAEQRAVAQAAVEEARLELEGLDGATLDETGVRRELESATRNERAATAALAEAEHEVAVLRDQLDALESERAALVATIDALAEAGAEAEVDAAEAEAVAAALADFDEHARDAGTDLDAATLGRELAALEPLVADLRRTVPDPPSAADLDGAAADVAAARRRLDLSRAAASSFAGPPPPWWDELNALHAEVADAETAVQTTGLRRGAARRRYEEALAAEHARLEELGFDSYLDVLMSAGRLPGERSDGERAVIEALDALARAEQRVEQLQADSVAGAPLQRLLADRDHLLRAAADLLGCDPGDRAVELLESHPAVPHRVVADLAAALRAAGVPTAGIGVGDAARAWLGSRDRADDTARVADAEHRLEAIAGERNRVAGALDPAVARADRAAAEAATAGRVVASLEAELRARAGEDGRLLERAVAARELRDQVEAVEARLAAAEAEALEAWAATGETLSAAEAERDRLDRDFADLNRRAARAAAELPVQRRPPVDLITGLVPLAGALRAEAALVDDALREADAAVGAVESTTGDPDDPTVDDLVAALDEVVRRAAGRAGTAPVVLAEPLNGLPSEVVEPVLAAFAATASEHPTIVVTKDLAVAGWAIGLPADAGALVAARSLGHLAVADRAAATTPGSNPFTHPTVD